MSAAGPSLLSQLVASQRGVITRTLATGGLEVALAAACTSLRHMTSASPWTLSAAAQPHQQETAQEPTSAGPSASTPHPDRPSQQPEEGQSTASSSGAQAGPSVDPAQAARRVFSAFRSGFDTVRSAAGAAGGESGAGGGNGSGAGGGHGGAGGHSVLQMMAREVVEVFRPTESPWSATRKYTGPVMEFGDGEGATTTALQLVRKQQSGWERVKDKVLDLPFLARLRSFRVSDTAAFKKGQEVVEDLKDKYETSDHPMVHKVDELKERVMSGSESSQAMREVRMRDPAFDLNTFVRAVKMDAPVVVRALLQRDLDTLSLHVGPEMMERLEGIFKHEAERGVEDPAILFVSDVEVVEVRAMEGDPFVVAQFHVQQLKCLRDKFGNVVEGSPETIQRVYYFWGLQQEKAGVITADGQVLPPRWVIKDMMWQSMLALV